MSLSKPFRFSLLTSLALSVFLSMSGCAVHMAATQPSAKPTRLFRVGTPKEKLIANFGAPTSTIVRNGTTYDVYTFTNGSNGGTKVFKCLLYGVCDLATLGITEVLFTPTECALRSRDKAYEVSYDADGRVASVVCLKW
ncbi:MAG: hypothetical protein WAL87_03825 [Chthoniobacterales bacterium]